MTFEIWNSEPFLREVEMGKRLTLLTKVIYDYALNRNIEVKDASKIAIVEYIIENQIHVPFLKLCTIKWALDKFTDPTNHNISAFIVFDLIKKAYQNEAHKAILKQWDILDQQNRLAPLSDMQKDELNKKARLDSWNKCIELCKNGQNIEDPNWINAIKYLSKDLAYQPEKKLVQHFEDVAKSIIFAKVEQDKSDVTKSRDQHKVSLKESLLIAANNIEGSDIESRIILLRRKLICKEYILKNVIDANY